MDLRIDLAAEPPEPELLEPDVFTSLRVAVSGPGDDEDLSAALAAVGRVDPGGGDAFLEVEPLARLAGERAEDPQWRSQFDGMVAYATGKGWADGEGRVQAHVEWIDRAPA